MATDVLIIGGGRPVLLTRMDTTAKGWADRVGTWCSPRTARPKPS
jgi:hypothetical protein